MKKFLSTLTGKIALVFAVLFLGLLVFLAFWNIKVFWIALVVLAFFVVAWILLDFAVRRFRARKQAAFDEGVAAKEGIDDRRREWTNWTAELKKQGIDRYELPFYLLVGEPQSGKSILLQNSDLHFPFGQSRLSGVGGTRGCDWWFTDEAVVLDLAGRLFTHEGGKSDEAEWEAFLDLLGNFRPQCPANGVLLVIPCDGLLKDTPQQAAAKASKIQSALLTLTGRMQARLPVYLVLTKADKIFGFAESVHRLEAAKRHEMFGWSRPAERFEAPFELTEVREAFDRLVDRARLLRANEMVNARIPEHLPQVDRLFAFPSELAAMYPALEIYLQRIFSESSLVERLFFRGFYLTSGLQTGAPIAKVCAEIFGAAGEADVRNLEALFTKQHGYFIKDLVRKRVFTERGLVRPTRKRAVSARRNAILGYGVSGVFAALTVVYAVYFFLAHEDEGQAKVYQTAVDSAQAEDREWPKILAQLTDVDAAVGHKIDLDHDLLTGLHGSLGNLYASVYDHRLMPAMRVAAEKKVLGALQRGSQNHAEFKASLAHVLDLLDERCTVEALNAILAAEPVTETSAGGQPTLTLAQALERRKTASDAPIPPSRPERADDAVARLTHIAKLAHGELDGVLDPGKPWHADGHLGFAIVSQRLRQLYEKLRRGDVSERARVFDDCDEYLRLEREQKELAKQLGGPLEEVSLEKQLEALDGDASDRKRVQERAGLPLAPAAQRLPLTGYLNEVWIAASKAPPPAGTLVNVPPVPGLRRIALSDAVFDAGQNSDLVKRILSTAPDALGPEAYRRADLGRALRTLRDEIKRDKNEAADKLLTTKCLALQERFLRDCPTLEACVERGLIADPERWQPGLVQAWVELHGALAEASPTAYAQWISQIVKLTGESMAPLNKKWNDKTGEALAADTPLSGWKSFRELAAARAYFAKAGPDTLTTAIDRALPRSLERRGETLVARWRGDAYPLEDATKTKDILSELEEQEQEVQRLATADPGLDRAVRTARGEWRRSAGELLATRLGTHASVLEQTWEVKLESSRSDLRESVRRVREITSSDWVDSRLENVREETDLCDFLRPNLKQLQDFPGAEKAASDLVDACFPHRGVEFSKKRWVIKLRQLSDELELAAEKRKADVLLLKLRDLVIDCKPPDDASSELQGAAQSIAKAMHRDLRHNVVAAIRWQYFADLTALFEKDFTALRDVFDAKEVPRIDNARDGELMQQLGSLLDRKGAYDRLREQYVGEELKNLLRRTDLPFRPESSEHSEEPFLAELAEHWRFDRFLAELQSFLLPTPDNESVASASVTLKLSWPGQGEQGALSHNGSYLYFYAPKDDRLRVDQVNNVGSSNSLELPFGLAPGPDKGLAFRWSMASKPTAELDDKDPAARIPSSLAPLLLAWSGKLEANQWVASLPVTVEGESQKADIRLSFPKRALPARVAVPPKAPKP